MPLIGKPKDITCRLGSNVWSNLGISSGRAPGDLNCTLFGRIASERSVDQSANISAIRNQTVRIAM